jgi:hypothetical protein
MRNQDAPPNGARYWVVGGEYADTTFERLSEEGASVFGPFGSYDDARHVWEAKTLESRPLALVRFTIAVSRAGLADERTPHPHA